MQQNESLPRAWPALGALLPARIWMEESYGAVSKREVERGETSQTDARRRYNQSIFRVSGRLHELEPHLVPPPMEVLGRCIANGVTSIEELMKATASAGVTASFEYHRRERFKIDSTAHERVRFCSGCRTRCFPHGAAASHTDAARAPPMSMLCFAMQVMAIAVRWLREGCAIMFGYDNADMRGALGKTVHWMTVLLIKRRPPAPLSGGGVRSSVPALTWKQLQPSLFQDLTTAQASARLKWDAKGTAAMQKWKMAPPVSAPPVVDGSVLSSIGLCKSVPAAARKDAASDAVSLTPARAASGPGRRSLGPLPSREHERKLVHHTYAPMAGNEWRWLDVRQGDTVEVLYSHQNVALCQATFGCSLPGYVWNWQLDERLPPPNAQYAELMPELIDALPVADRRSLLRISLWQQVRARTAPLTQALWMHGAWWS